MLAGRALAKRLFEHDRTRARRLAQTARRLGVEGETIEETSGAFALFAGPESPVDLARGDFYPANVEDFAKFYGRRREDWTAVATPFDHPNGINALIAIGGRTVNWESVLVRTLDKLPELATPEEVQVQRVEELEPWAEITRNGTWGAWSDDPLPEGYRVLAETQGFTRYLAIKGGAPVAAAMMFVADGTALVADISAASETYDPNVQNALWSRLLHDAAKEADLAWIETDNAVVHMETEQSGFHMVYSQLVFSVPAA